MYSAISAPHISSDLQQYRYLTEKEVAAITDRALQTLRNDQCKGQGSAPPLWAIKFIFIKSSFALLVSLVRKL